MSTEVGRADRGRAGRKRMHGVAREDGVEKRGAHGHVETYVIHSRIKARAIKAHLRHRTL